MLTPVRSNTPPPVVGPDLAGWLEKQADWKFAWNRRFVELCGTIISYREEGATSDKKCAEIRCLQKNCAGSPPNTFRVWTDRGGCWVLRCASQEEHHQWTSAVAAALHEEHPEEELKCSVEKCSAWTKQWRTRYVTLSGLKLSYSESQGGPVKNRYVVASADACLNETEICVAVSTGERFALRFPDATLARQWLSTIRRTQRRVHTLRWQAVALTSDGSSVCGAVGHSAASFEGKHILVFGGSILTPKHGNQLQRELVMASLVGDHPASVIHAPPLEEATGAKVCPAARELGAVTLLPNGHFVLYGGIAGRPLEVLQDGWTTHVAIRGPWDRFQSPSPPSPSMRLPPLFGHSMHALVPSMNASSSAVLHASPSTSSQGGGVSPIDVNSFLVVGGFDAKLMAQGDVFHCTVHSVDAGAPSAQIASKLRVVRCPPMDKPRGMHSGVDLGGGTIVLVGGTHGRYHGLEDDGGMSAAASEDGAHTTLSVLNHHDDAIESMRWRSVALSPPLPPNTLRPGACAHGGTIFVWCRDQQGAGTLYSINISPEIAVVTPFVTRGDVPSITRGVSLHMSDDYCYLFGGGGTGGGVHRILPPPHGEVDTSSPQRPSSADERL